MPIIVSQNGKNAKKLDKISFGLEDKLQQYIYDNPESIPLYDIKDDIQLLILAREFSTNSGPIDAVGIDQDGQIYLIETKLYKNPDKRTVIAQVIDYGASLWRTLTDFDAFLLQLNSHVQKKFNMSTTEKIQEYFSVDDDQMQSILEQMKFNLDEGNFKFVVMMDSLEDRLKDLIIYMNQNSKFDIYGVELEYYQHDSFEIMIPKIYGAQVKKDVKVSRNTGTNYSDGDFKKLFSEAGYSDQINELLELADDIVNGKITISGLKVHKSPSYLNFRFFYPNATKQALSVSLGIRGGKPLNQLDFWCDDSTHQDKLLKPISNLLGKKVEPISNKSGIGMLARQKLEKVSIESLITLFKTLSNNQ